MVGSEVTHVTSTGLEALAENTPIVDTRFPDDGCLADLAFAISSASTEFAAGVTPFSCKPNAAVTVRTAQLMLRKVRRQIVLNDFEVVEIDLILFILAAIETRG